MNSNDLLRSLGSSLLFFCLTSHAFAKIRVVTTIPEIAYAAREIGGELVDARALLKGTENPHHLDAVPEFVRLVADADVVCLVGLGLEVGYMPPVFARSGNAKVQPGGPGYCEVGRAIAPLEKPTGSVDRSLGDVHPEGNPHFWLSPRTLAESAKEIAQALSRVDPAHETAYKRGLSEFEAKMKRISTKVENLLKPALAKASPDNKPVVLEYHKEFTYFFAAYGLKSFGSLEEKPGVPPSAGRIAEIAQLSKGAKLRAALCTDYNPESVLRKFEEIAHIPALKLQTMIRPNRGIGEYEELQLTIANAIVKALSEDPK